MEEPISFEKATFLLCIKWQAAWLEVWLWTANFKFNVFEQKGMIRLPLHSNVYRDSAPSVRAAECVGKRMLFEVWSDNNWASYPIMVKAESNWLCKIWLELFRVGERKSQSISQATQSNPKRWSWKGGAGEQDRHHRTELPTNWGSGLQTTVLLLHVPTTCLIWVSRSSIHLALNRKGSLPAPSSIGSILILIPSDSEVSGGDDERNRWWRQQRRLGLR